MLKLCTALDLRCQISTGVALFVAAAVITPPSATAQTLRGSVLEEGRETPVVGAAISLVDPEGKHWADAISDSLGRFLLAPPVAGDYVIQAVALGYAPTTSPLFSMTVGGSLPFDMMMRADPIGLEGFDVSVEPIEVVATQLLQHFGHTPETLRNRWIDRAEIERMMTPGLTKDIIRRQNIAGVWVEELPPFCLKFSRRTRKCALTVLNGMVVPAGVVYDLDTRDIEAIAILTPTDAATFYGTQAGGGAVLIWTRLGGR